MRYLLPETAARWLTSYVNRFDDYVIISNLFEAEFIPRITRIQPPERPTGAGAISRLLSFETNKIPGPFQFTGHRMLMAGFCPHPSSTFYSYSRISRHGIASLRATNAATIFGRLSVRANKSIELVTVLVLFQHLTRTKWTFIVLTGLD